MSFRSYLTPSSLQGRIFLLTATGMVAILAVIGVSEYQGSQAISDEILKQRISLAQTIAGNLERALRQNLRHLQNLGFYRGFNLSDDDPGPEKSALHALRLQSHFTTVSLWDTNGKLLMADPAGKDLQASVENDSQLKQALSQRKPAVSNLMDHGDGSQLWVLVPIRNAIAAGSMRPNGDFFRSILDTVQTTRDTRIRTIDKNGIVIASTLNTELFKNAKTLADKTAMEIVETESGVEEVQVSAPVKGTPWTLQILQSREELLKPVETMRRRFFTFSLILFAAALLFSWGLAQSIVKPVNALVRSAEQISSGDLNTSIKISGDNEIARLGRTLDEMRSKLKTSMDEIGRWNKELEERVKERTQKISELFEELKQKEELRGHLLLKVMAVQEEERKRIARELHDETSQTLTALLMKLQAIAGDEAKQHTAGLNSAVELAERAIEGVHRMIFDLRPSVLDDLGLSAAIRWYAEERLKSTGIQPYLEGEFQSKIQIPQVIETALFRIAQEALSNVARHSKAESVMISLEADDSNVTLEIEDDGIGFSPESVELNADSDAGLGLLGIKERAELLGGTFMIESAPGDGTLIRVKIPVKGIVHHG